MKDTVNILGTPYRIYLVSASEYKADGNPPGTTGYSNSYSKRIVILDRRTLTRRPHTHESEEESWEAMWKTLRHEVVHVYLFESGLRNNTFVMDDETPWAMNEEMVDWFALQGPKIEKSWKEATDVIKRIVAAQEVEKAEKERRDEDDRKQNAPD